MEQINVFTKKEIEALKKVIPNTRAKRLKVNGQTTYVLCPDKQNWAYGPSSESHAYPVSTNDIIEPTPEQLIEVGIVTYEEYRDSLF